MARPERSTATLLDVIAAASGDALPTDAVERATWLLVDTLICIVSGEAVLGDDAHGSTIVDRILRSLGGAPEATVVPEGWSTAAPLAAFAHANKAKALDLDDNLLYNARIGNVVASTGLAIGESQRASMVDVARAVVLGYEVAARVSLSLPLFRIADDGSPGFENPHTQSYDTLGAAVAAAVVLGADREQLAHALGIAAVSAPVSSMARSTSSDEWPLFRFGAYGQQAFSGCVAALLAVEGLTSDTNILDGDDGFWRMSGARTSRPEALTEGLGERWWISESSTKYEPAGTWMRSATRAIRCAKAGRVVTATDIENIEVHTRAFGAGVFQNRTQRGYMDALVSYPYLVAVEACGIAPHRWPTSEVYLDEDIQRVVEGVRMVASEAADRALLEELRKPPFRASGVDAHVVIKLRTGETLEGDSRYGDGDPGDPSTRPDLDGLLAKFDAFAAPLFAPGTRDRLQQLLDEPSRPVGELVAIFTSPAHQGHTLVRR